VGLTAFNTGGHIMRAALESAALQVRDVSDPFLTDNLDDC
jgi:glycerol kinase